MRPDIFDDGSLCEQPFKKVKAFTDVGNIESMSKERWGAAKWVKGQTRIYCVNDFDVKAEPKLNQPLLEIENGVPSYVSHDEFMKMLESAWCSKDLSETNIMAVLKRTHVFLNTSQCLYIRPASEVATPVIRIPLGKKTDLLHAESRGVYDYHRKGGVDLPADFEEKVEWEANWVKKAMAGDVANLPKRVTIISRGSPFGCAASRPEPSQHNPVGINIAEELRRNMTLPPTLPKPHANTACAAASASASADGAASKAAIPPVNSTPTRKPMAVKQEIPSNVFRSLSAVNVVIDLDDSPSPVRKPSVSKVPVNVTTISKPSTDMSEHAGAPDELEGLSQDLEKLLEQEMEYMEDDLRREAEDEAGDMSCDLEGVPGADAQDERDAHDEMDVEEGM